MGRNVIMQWSTNQMDPAEILQTPNFLCMQVYQILLHVWGLVPRLGDPGDPAVQFLHMLDS